MLLMIVNLCCKDFLELTSNTKRLIIMTCLLA